MKKRKLGILIILLLVLGIAVPETVQPVTVEAAARLATKKKTILMYHSLQRKREKPLSQQPLADENINVYSQ